jgi:hypothetical protein
MHDRAEDRVLAGPIVPDRLEGDGLVDHRTCPVTGIALMQKAMQVSDR